MSNKTVDVLNLNLVYGNSRLPVNNASLLKLIAKNPDSSTISLAESPARSFALSIKRKRKNFNQVARELCFMIE